MCSQYNYSNEYIQMQACMVDYCGYVFHIHESSGISLHMSTISGFFPFAVFGSAKPGRSSPSRVIHFTGSHDGIFRKHRRILRWKIYVRSSTKGTFGNCCLSDAWTANWTLYRHRRRYELTAWARHRGTPQLGIFKRPLPRWNFKALRKRLMAAELPFLSGRPSKLSLTTRSSSLSVDTLRTWTILRGACSVQRDDVAKRLHRIPSRLQISL